MIKTDIRVSDVSELLVSYLFYFIQVYKHRTVLFSSAVHVQLNTGYSGIHKQCNEGKTFIQKYIQQLFGARHVLKTEANS